ncbi:hypothetical protein GCM10028827_12370 [Mucilaginibacter myungsuensis]
MQPGVGPKIKLVPHLENQYQTSLFGQYDSKTKMLEINEDYIKALEAASLPRKIQAVSLLLAITTLHEFVHYGRDANGKPRLYFDPKDGGVEAGFSFELNIDTTGSGGIDSNTAYRWIKIYPYNF